MAWWNRTACKGRKRPAVGVRCLDFGLIETAAVDMHTAVNRHALSCKCSDRLDQRTCPARTETARDIAAFECQVESGGNRWTDEDDVAYCHLALHYLNPPKTERIARCHVQPISAPYAAGGDPENYCRACGKNAESIPALPVHHQIPGFKVG